MSELNVTICKRLTIAIIIWLVAIGARNLICNNEIFQHRHILFNESCTVGNLSSVKIHLLYGGPCVNLDKHYCMIQAIINGHYEIVELLLNDYYYNIIPHSYELIEVAAKQNQTQIVELLLRHPYFQREDIYDMVFTYAMHKKNRSIIKLIYKYSYYYRTYYGDIIDII